MNFLHVLLIKADRILHFFHLFCLNVIIIVMAQALTKGKRKIEN